MSFKRPSTRPLAFLTKLAPPVPLPHERDARAYIAAIIRPRDNLPARLRALYARRELSLSRSPDQRAGTERHLWSPPPSRWTLSCRRYPAWCQFDWARRAPDRAG